MLNRNFVGLQKGVQCMSLYDKQDVLCVYLATIENEVRASTLRIDYRLVLLLGDSGRSIDQQT